MTTRPTRRSILLAGSAALLAGCAGRSAGSKAALARGTTTTSPEGTPPTSGRPPETATTGRSPGGPARFVQRGSPQSKGVALTFHVADDPALCKRLFDEAAASGVPLTLFLVGTWAAANPAMVRDLASAGHEIANHTATHPTLGRLGASDVAREITGCQHILERELGNPGRWFRPSGMEIATPLVLSEAGRAGYDTVVGYSLDPHDYQDPGAAAVTERFRNGVTAGSIASLHTSHQGTIDAFGDLVAAIRNAGLRPMTVSQLLAAS